MYFYASIIGLFWFTYNSGQNIWNRIVESSKTGKEKKSWLSIFACFLTAIAKV